MPLTDDELASLRSTLETRLAQLQQEIESKLDAAAEESGSLERTADSGEVSVTEDATTSEFADARRDVQEAREIEATFQRMTDGQYGICVDCGIDIPLERLHAQPTALRCITCQTRFEQQHGIRPTTM
ncbi:MAG TPA: TraR/DksA C4-type zinc finger protein [Burkholderiaceae bacterium]|jgi:DnaK suppressor protein|nr:TraR/DksA C4-type zinc finger protein [Burkholderiaceae bacterium]